MTTRITIFIYIAGAVFFGGGAAIATLDDPIRWGDFSIHIFLAGISLFMFFWVRINLRNRHDTLRWLRDNKNLLTEEEQYFRDSPFPLLGISKKSQMRTFKVVTSILFVTVVHDVGGDLRYNFLRGVTATAWTLVFGWWGLPWGPIRTIQALVINFSGGEKDTAYQAALTAEAALRIEGGES